MDEADRDIRNRTYALFVEFGRAPTAAEVGPGTEEAWLRLHEQHALVLDKRGELLMANPFSAIPTPYEIDTPDGRIWYGNCARRRLSAPRQDTRAKPVCPSAWAAASGPNSSRTKNSARDDLHDRRACARI